MKRVLVTGGGGFVGSHVLAPLRERGFEVFAPRSAEIDLLTPDGAQRAVELARPTHLLHLAWYAEHGHFWASEENLRWVEASLRLLRAFAAAGGQRAVMAGTCAEYAWTADGDRLHEARSPLCPATLYGAAKHALHVVAAPWAGQAGVSLAWGRIFFLHGPGEAPGRLVASVARALAAGQPAETSSGTQEIDLLHVADVGAAFTALLDAQTTGPVNVASGAGCSIREVVEALAAIAGRPDLLRVGARPDRPGEPPRLVGDATRLREEVGWRPAQSLEEGLAATLAWWRAQAPTR
jgi:nucleoside-diphosphate-sugar epimerase